MASKITKAGTGNIDTDNPEFQSAWSLIEKTNQSIFLTGKAGTGKSTFLRYITENTKKKFVVLAPTGIAAVNVGGQTLHSFFRIPLKPMLPDDPDFSVRRMRQRLKYPPDHIKLIRELDLIIIDEISMVRSDIIDFIDRVLRVYSTNMRQPFGGKQLLLVGDVFQLEPVVTGDERDILSRYYTSFYFFNAIAFKQIDIVPIELVKVYRQEEQSFVRILDNVRTGRPSQADIDALNSRFTPHVADVVTSDGSDDFTMTIASRRDMVDSINDMHLKALKTPPVQFEGLIEGDFPLQSLPTDRNLELKVGAQVVFVRNDTERRWVNGTLGVVDSVAPDQLTVRTEDNVLHEVEPERWENVHYLYNEETRKIEEDVLGSFTQYPLKPAWALTIHKSQGLTFNKVIIDMGRGAFAGGQTYVALSRCRSLQGITLNNTIHPRDIFVNPEIVRFAARFNNSDLIESAFLASRADTCFAHASRMFAQGNYSEALRAYNEGIAIKPSLLNDPRIARLLNIKMLAIARLSGRIRELENTLRDNNRRFSKIADRHVVLANEILNDGGWEADAALAQFDSALQVQPSYSPALIGKANLLLKMGQYEQAETMFAELAGMGQSEAWIGLMGIGDVRLNMEDLFGAADAYMSAHDANPRATQPLERLIVLYGKVGDSESVTKYRQQLNKLKRKGRKK